MAWAGLAIAGGKAGVDAISGAAADSGKNGGTGKHLPGYSLGHELSKTGSWMWRGAPDDNNENEAKDAYYDDSGSAAYQQQMNAWLQGVANRKAPQAGPASTAGPAWANAAHIDTAQSDASRAKQEAAYAMFAQQAAGKGPSVATQQMKANVDAANAANMAFAASARGRVNPMLAARQAAMSNAANIQAGARDSAMLRTQEQIAGQNAMWQAAYGLRSQDMQGAQAQAQFGQQANLANAGFAQQASLFNAEAANKVALANLEATLRARGMDDATIGNIIASKQMQMNQDKHDRMAYWGYQTGSDQFNASLAQQKAQYDQTRQDQIWSGVGQGAAAGLSAYGASNSGGGGGKSSADDAFENYYKKTEL